MNIDGPNLKTRLKRDQLRALVRELGVTTVRYPGGLRVDIEVHGDQVRGLPTTFDYDYFLALCRIADEGGVDSQGYFVDPGYRAVLRAAGESE